ncbi:hypothetical protein FIA58_007540 [Flavobacterium jejuense]|uniref:Uncharacterized protein n=1 Tax=Flavobacterium jejuense TaxID=1544455 RepID=A0ABX0IRP2_9FLAO|nr:hypothetical protein [Flavobacterium jejuense]NHN25527.1 hypothetical protein [Flavobacterium jejuense]
MDYKKLKIIHLDKLNDNIVVGVNFRDENTKLKAIDKDKSFFLNEFKNKKIRIEGSNYSKEANIVDIEVSSNIAEMKMMHFLTDLKSIDEMKENDNVEVL